MAYLKKEQYSYRERAAQRRAVENEEIAVLHGMTEEQAELISELCRLRHKLHTNMDRVTISDTDTHIKSELVEVARKIDAAGLPQVPCIPIGEGDYIDIDDMDLLFECVVWPESESQEWLELYVDEYTRIYSELEQLNTDIEKYLAEIDKQYGTSWCPTGALRIM